MMKRKIWMPILLLVLIAVLAAVVPSVQSRICEGGRTAIREAVLRAAVECYSVEGAYPESLDYLTEYYGLSINRNRYIVVYDAFASNQLPDIQVLVRGEYVR